MTKTATIRDFSGGWNAADNDQNLSSKFLTLSDNINVGIDGSIAPRPGYRLFIDLATLISTSTIIDMTYFQEHLVVFYADGRIVSVNKNGVAAIIWSTALANALPGAPAGWGVTNYVSFTTWKQTLLVVNGRNGDKPIEISFVRSAGAITQYLVDPATNSNSAVPRGDFIQAFDTYVMIYATSNVSGPLASATFVDISASGTSGVYVGNASPADAVKVDIARGSRTLEPRITGVGLIRDRLVVCMTDSAVIGKLGIYSGAVHDPDFSDLVPQHGAINHRVMVNIGNDLIMTDYTGVPAFTQAIQSGTFIPERYSQLIEPVINKHFSRLSLTTLQFRVFAIYNIRDRQYMLFVPKYDQVARSVDANPIFLLGEYDNTNRVMIRIPQHGYEIGDFIIVANATNVGSLLAANINGTRKIVGVIDEDNVVIEVGQTVTEESIQGGGTNVTVTPVNDETIGYIFTLNPQLRIRRWSRYRGLQFDCGCISLLGSVFFARNNKIYQFGTASNPIYADAIGDYDNAAWATSTNYAIGTRVRDGSVVYECLVAHTSPSSGTFANYRTANPTHWEIYTGREITFEAESPWSDFSERMNVKETNNVRIDAQGSGRFSLSFFVDNIYRDIISQNLIPAAKLDFVGRDAGGFGNQSQTFGGGRRTREQNYYAMPTRSNIMKMRIEGKTKQPIRIVTIAVNYKLGSILR